MVMAPALSLSTRVKIRDDVLFRELQDELVMLELKQGVYFGLDAIGTRIWHLLHGQRSLGEVLATLVQEYDVAEAQGAEDLLGLVGQLREHGLLELSD
jgi:hypothetical protein